MLLLLLLAHLTTAADSPRDTFRDDWKGRAVILKQPLYTILFDREPHAITIATPDRGIFYSGHFTGWKTYTDRDPQQLLAKAVATGAWSVEPTLLTYPVGARMRVKDIGYSKRRIWFGLYDEFTTTGAATTALFVEMPADISTDLWERAEVERIAATVFDW